MVLTSISLQSWDYCKTRLNPNSRTTRDEKNPRLVSVRPGLDKQILALNPKEGEVKLEKIEIAKRAQEILQKVDFLEVKKAGPAATAFYVWVRTCTCSTYKHTVRSLIKNHT